LESEAQPGPSGAGWREELARFESGGRRLVGVLCLPDPGPGTANPAVLVVHGWGSYRSGPHRMLVELCRTLARRGLAVLRFDLSGRGDSAGAYWKTDLDTMIADAVAAAGFLAGRVGTEKLAAVGLCSGANVALGAATVEPRLGAVCALSTLPFQKQRRESQRAARAKATLRELVLTAFRPATWRRLLRGEVALGRILRRLFLGEGGRSARVRKADGGQRNLKDSERDIQAELAGYRGRLLFVYGAADAEGLSGWRGVLEPFLTRSGVDHRQVEVPGANHDYHGLAAKRRAIDAAVEFLAGAG